MAVIIGYKGIVKVGATPTVMGEVQNFNIDHKADVLDTTALGSNGCRTFERGLSQWSVNMTANFDPSDTGQALLSVGATVAIELYVGGDATGNYKYSGSAVIESIPISNEVAGIVTTTMNLTGTGCLTSEVIV
jgi:hypothetical protein